MGHGLPLAMDGFPVLNTHERPSSPGRSSITPPGAAAVSLPFDEHQNPIRA